MKKLVPIAAAAALSATAAIPHSHDESRISLQLWIVAASYPTPALLGLDLDGYG
jgi:hypothetical protein